ncbi:MAG TPA: thermonuclease family protein [Solirubrobacteraceae bacterium]
MRWTILLPWLAVAALAVTVVLGGCGRAGAGGDLTTAPGSTTSARVERVVDGDTVVVRIGGRRERERVRYIGIDTPESVKPDTPVQCYAKAASRENDRLVAGREVRLVFDREARDVYGRLLAYVYRASDGLFVNRDLVRLGYAKTLVIRPNVAHEREFAALRRTAQSRALGLWGAC